MFLEMISLVRKMQGQDVTEKRDRLRGKLSGVKEYM